MTVVETSTKSAELYTCMSVPQMPHARTRTTTPSRPADGAGTSTTWTSLLPTNATAFMVTLL